MATSNNEFRVFISSTFQDLQEEREHLVKKIFPEIRALCRQRGIRFTEVDLRWGLTEEDVALGQVIRTCLEEVDKCRPYFIGITGERYGFVPSYLDVQKDPVLLEQFPWVEEAAIEEMSITEMEAQYGVLRGTRDAARTASPSLRQAREGEAGRGPNADAAASGVELHRARFYFRRHRASLDDVPDDVERSRLEAYQHRIRKSGAPVQEYRDPGSLGELIYDDLVEIIKRDFAGSKPPTPLQEERSRHEAFSLSRRRAYIANPQYLKRLNDYVASNDPPLVVYAESGSGKSSLFAFWAELYRRKHPEAHVIEHYVGIGATATDHYGVIRHVCMEIKDRFGREEEIPTGPEELEKAFGQWLGYADHALQQTGERLVLILDGLNQLKGSALRLQWIPDVISPSIRLILSSTVEGTLMELQKRGWKTLGMQALSEAEREAVVVRYLAEYHKSLNSEQIKRIAGDYKCGHPLFLKTLLEELRLVGQHEALDERIDVYLEATGTEDLFQRVLDRLEEDYNMRSVRDVMTLLWCSRTGLDERELSEVSGLARLKIATMVAGLDYHLVRKEGRLSFFHDYLRRAVEKRYLADETFRRRTHGRLASHFEMLEVTERSARERIWGCAESGDDEKLVSTLGDVAVLEVLYKGTGAEEVLAQWARLRESGKDPESTYRASLEAVRRWTDTLRQVRAILAVANVLERLGMWSGAMELTRRALSAAIETDHPTEIARAERALGWLLHLRGEYSEALQRLEHALQLYEELDEPHGVAGAIGNVGTVHSYRGDYDLALASYERQLMISEGLDDRQGVAHAVGNMANVYFFRGEFDRALASYERGLSILEELGDRCGVAIAVGNTGIVYYQHGDFDRALASFERQLTISEKLGDRRVAALAMGNIGLVHARQGEYDRAFAACTRQVTICEELGDRRGVASAMRNMGEVHGRRGEYDSALSCYQRALTISEELGDGRSAIYSVGSMGFVYLALGKYEDALRCFEQATDERRGAGFRFGHPHWLSGRSAVLLEVTQCGGAMPAYLPQFVPDLLDPPEGGTAACLEVSEHPGWQAVVRAEARALAKECVEISAELSKRDTLFDGRVLLSRIDAAEGNAETARARLVEMLEERSPTSSLGDPSRSSHDVTPTLTAEDSGLPSGEAAAVLHYWLWKLGLDPATAHRAEAERLYADLLGSLPMHDYRVKLSELRSKPVTPSPAAEADDVAVDQ